MERVASQKLRYAAARGTVLPVGACRLAAALAAAAATALLLASGAGATIVPQQGMAGVALEMTRAQVRAVLGTPAGVVHATNEFGAYTEFRYRFRVRVTFQGNATVTSVSTTGVRERTADGAGVGSTERQLRARVAHLRCETVASFRHCFVGRFVAGHRVTDFRIQRGKVTRVLVGFVID
jgi:hypothetical protein